MTTARHRFEVFFYKTGVRVFPRTKANVPVAVSKLTGEADFSLPGISQSLAFPLQGHAPARGREPESLDLSADLSWVPVRDVKVAFKISGLADSEEPVASFTVPFVLVSSISPAAPAGEFAFAIARPEDRSAIDAQKVCPVCGKPLGSAGQPIKVSRGGQVAFLDSEACVAAFRKEPERYFEVAARPQPALVLPSAPRYAYRSGYYGVGYYPSAAASPEVVAAPAPAPVREVPLERSWSSPHWSFDYAEWQDHNL